MESLVSIEQRLSNIENLLISQKTVFTFDEFCIYANISKSYGYKLTSKNRVPHYKPAGKMVYFNRIEIDNWLMQNPIKTQNEIEQKAIDYVVSSKPSNKKGGKK